MKKNAATVLRHALLVLTLLAMLMVKAEAAEEGAGLMKYKDPKQPINARIRDLMGRMTLQEKIGQMIQLDRAKATAEVLRRYSIGSVLSGGGSVPLPRATAKDWMEMVNDYQNASLNSRLGIPMIYGIDAVHGHNNVYNATIFPHNVGLGAARDPELVKRIGAATALEVRATGIPYVFARVSRCVEIPDGGDATRAIVKITRLSKR